MIDQLTICKWVGNSSEDQTIQDPTWREIEEAIKALNGREFNDLYLTPLSSNVETYLAVGGGNGQYIVTGSINNEKFPTYIEPGKPESKLVPLLVGGQEGDYPDNWIIGLELSLSVVKEFFESGGFEGSELWQYV